MIDWLLFTAVLAILGWPRSSLPEEVLELTVKLCREFRVPEKMMSLSFEATDGFTVVTAVK